MTRALSLLVALALLASCEGCGLQGEQYVDAPLARSELVALHDPPRVIVRTAGRLDLVGETDNRSSETEHLSWVEPAAQVLGAIRGAQYLSVERDGAITYLAVHRGAAELPETALLRDGDGWRIVRRLAVGMRRDHAVVARLGDDGRLEPRAHPASERWIEDLKARIGEDAEAERVAQAVVALGGDATPLLLWYLERERPDADALVLAVATLCTGDVDLAQRIAPRERDPALARCLRLPDREGEVCGRGAWVRVEGDADARSTPPPAEALEGFNAPTDAIAGALSLCGGARLGAHLQRGIAAMLAGNLEVGAVLRHHPLEVRQRAVQQLDAARRPTAGRLLGLEQDAQEVARAMASPALVPTLGALECFDGRLQADGFVLYDPDRDGPAVLDPMLTDGPLASRIVAYALHPGLDAPEDAAVRARALAQLYVDLSAADETARAAMNTYYACSYIPPWPRTRGGAYRNGHRTPTMLLWDLRAGLLTRVAQLPEDPALDALLATAHQDTMRWAAAYVRSDSPKAIEPRAREAICRCHVRRITEFGRPGSSECGLLDAAASVKGAQLDWRALAAAAPEICAPSRP